jgi:L,D-transpeptidase ErfK/SrfK
VLPRRIPPGPDNPLGAYAIQLETPGYFIHGTNRPIGVGQRVSHGCIRLYPEHIETLIEMVANGTQVRVIRQPHKAGLVDGVLYLESHADDEVGSPLTAYVREIVRATDGTVTRVDWDKATNIARAGRGLPTRVSF